jgi:hypothetical protein
MEESMPQAVANLDQMDEHLKTIVQALYGAVKQGIPMSRSRPSSTRRLPIARKFSTK